jgi:hypothetical protein
LGVHGRPTGRNFFFDICNGDQLTADDEGMELPDIEAAQEEAARSLADLARDHIRRQPSCRMAIEVRDSNGPVLEASFFWRVVSKH